MDVSKLIVAVEQLIKDAPPVVTDIEAVIEAVIAAIEAPAVAGAAATKIDWANLVKLVVQYLPLIISLIPKAEAK